MLGRSRRRLARLRARSSCGRRGTTTTAFAEFHAWIDRLETLGARLWNPPGDAALEHGQALSRTGCRIRDLSPPPTAILDRGSTVDLPTLLEARGWDEAVIKPAISADGYSTERTSRRRAASDQAALDAMLARGDVDRPAAGA